MTHLKQLPLLLALSFLGLSGCRDHTTSVSNLPTAPMTIGRNTYTLEIAAKFHDREKGLMQRDSMPKDHGMIFLFADAEIQKFWMKNTRFPLDILFLDGDGKIVSIHRMEPYVTERETVSKAPAKYAIELNAGEAQAAGVKEGDTLQLPAEVKSTVADP